MVIETNSTDDSASVSTNPVDEIANMFEGVGEPEKDDTEDDANAIDSGDADEVEGQSDESTDDVDEANAEAEGDVENKDEGDDTWSSVLGVDEEKLAFDEDGNISGINVKVDGEVSTENLGDVIAGYQNNKHNTQKSQVLAKEISEFNEVKVQVVQEYKSKLDQAGNLNQLLEKRLVSDYDSIDWEKLRTEDAGKYAALRQDFSEKAQEIESVKTAIDTEKQEEQQKILEENQTKQQVYLGEQKAKMIESNPTWSDDKVRVKEMGTIATFLNDNYGFSANDLKHVQDARLIELVKDAMKFKTGSKVADKKIGKPVPKFQKSTSKSKKKDGKLEILTKRAKGATGANKRHAQSDAITALLIGEN